VIDSGESVLEGIGREVAEETGLIVTKWSGKLYEISATAPEMGWNLRVEAWHAESWEGELRFDDPDGIVESAAWVDPLNCGAHLNDGAPWVAEPVLEWLLHRWVDPRTFSYMIEGSDRSSLVVTRM
jgi:8-oxo-dGTP diphosphatase